MALIESSLSRMRRAASAGVLLLASRSRIPMVERARVLSMRMRVRSIARICAPSSTVIASSRSVVEALPPAPVIETLLSDSTPLGPLLEKLPKARNRMP